MPENLCGVFQRDFFSIAVREQVVDHRGSGDAGELGVTVQLHELFVEHGDQLAEGGLGGSGHGCFRFAVVL